MYECMQSPALDVYIIRHLFLFGEGARPPPPPPGGGGVKQNGLSETDSML